MTIKPHRPEPKKPYAPPKLVAYGTVCKLTQRGSGSGADAGPGGMAMDRG